MRFALRALFSGAALLLLICAPALNALHAEGPTFHESSEPGLETALLPTLFASSHAANLLVLRNGDVLCFWFSGTWEGDSNVGIVVSRLPRGTSTWEKPILIDQQPGKSYQNPVPFQAPDGRIWLFHTSQSAGKGQADAQVLRVWSDDDGHTWSKPEVLFAKPGSYARQPVVIMDDGAWLLPMYYTPSAGITNGATSNYSVTEISHDSGKTWQECRVPESNGLVQPSVVKVGKSAYVAFFRSRYADWVYRSTSSDGCHWAPPTPTTLPNNNASIQVTRLRDGRLAIAFNNSSAGVYDHKPHTGPRVPLSVALSDDNGEHWTSVRDLERGDGDASADQHFPKRSAREEFSYPSILQLPGGKILVAYTWRREAIKAALFSEAWVGEGNTTGQFRPPRR